MRFNIVDEGIVWKNPYPNFRAMVTWHGHTENLGGGHLIHTARMGKTKLGLDGKCEVFRSKDHGKTWLHTNSLLADEYIDPQFAYSTATPKLTEDGTLWAAAGRWHWVEPEHPRWTKDNGGWLYCENFICRSQDQGYKWSEPQYIKPKPTPGAFPTIATPVNELSSGELMIMFESFFTETVQKMQHEVSSLFSRDGGDSWGEQTLVAHDPNDRLIYFDPRPAKLSDDCWICFFWTHDKKTDEALNTTIAYSEDGRHWSKPEESALWGFPTLPLVLPDGGLLAVYNYRRNPQGIRCALSEDSGKHWDMENEYVIWDQQTRRVTGELASQGEKRAWDGSCMAEMYTWDFGVPHPTLLDDGSVLVTFYATELDHVTHQRYVRLSIDKY